VAVPVGAVVVVFTTNEPFTFTALPVDGVSVIPPVALVILTGPVPVVTNEFAVMLPVVVMLPALKLPVIVALLRVVALAVTLPVTVNVLLAHFKLATLSTVLPSVL
jgi:hypothetical protein